MSEVTYNGVVIKDVLTQSIDQTPVYSVGEVDEIFVKTTVSIKFTFHTVSGAGLGYHAGANLASGTEAVLRRLTTSRRRFTMTIGGVSLFDIAPGATEPDVSVSGNIQDIDNGPRPTCKIDEINGIGVARGTFTVVFATPSCGTPQSVVNLRWWTSDDIDNNWYTTRTISGRLRVANKNIGPHEMRGLVFPPLQPGFRRDKMSFSEDPNGLALDFTITDLEVYRSAPSPASTWRGNHRISSQVPGASVVESEASVELTGAHDVHQTELILLGVKIIDAKLQLQNQGVTGKKSPGDTKKARALVMFYAIDASMDENRVQIICRIKHYGKDGEGFSFFNQVGPQFGQPLPANINTDGTSYSPLKSRLLPGATAPLTTIMVNQLQTPCNPAQMDNAFDTRTERNPSASPGDGEKPDVDTDKKPIPPEPDPVGASEEHKKSPYTYYKTNVYVKTISSGAAAAIAQETSSQSDDAVFVKFGPSVTHYTVTVRAARIGVDPKGLKPLEQFQDDKGRTFFLIGSDVSLPSDDKDANGTPERVIHQYLKYLMSTNPDINAEGIPKVKQPWLDSGQSSETPPGVLSRNPLTGE